MHAVPWTSFSRVLVFAAGLRVVLIIFGIWQDSHLAVRYTDIDYDVVTDAAREVAEDRSPYLRQTYRYTPFLAFALLPNIWLHPVCGKLIFSSVDLIVALLIRSYVRTKLAAWPGICEAERARITSASAACWLFNPYTATISTRGNGDSIVVLLQLGTLLLLQPVGAHWRTKTSHPASSRLIAAAGLVFGALVHWRVFPVIYGPSLIVSFLTPGLEGRSSLRSLRSCALFGASALVAFGALGVASFRLYGADFLHEAFLYHASRRDPRHNFSPHFLFTYLDTARAAMPGHALSAVPTWMDPSLGSTACMGAALLAIAGVMPHNLAGAWLVSTVVFVALNKVSTAQYFVWYMGVLPTVVPELWLRWGWLQSLAVLLWACTQLGWLAVAYLLEFEGKAAFVLLWLMGLAFMSAQLFLACTLLVALDHSEERTDSEDKKVT